jgi:hypothetical protein
MARRSKAASRRERQRRAKQRPVQPRGPVQPQPIQGAVSEAIEAAASERAESALERAERAEREERPGRRTPARSTGTRGSRADPRFTVAGPSRLSANAAAEYHYVLRDVRNIGVLVAVMAVLLVAAVIAFNALGIGTAA